MNSTSPLLKVENLGTVFPGGTRALNDVSFEVEPGEFVVVLGPSGAGKTTLLRSMNGLSKPTKGSVTLNDHLVCEETLPKIRKNVGMVFQNFNLVGNLSALNNVLTGLLGSCSFSSIFYKFSKEQKLRGLECLDRVGLLLKAYSRADQLSGGEQQRVGIARAIVKRPLLLLADEPVASLDPMIAFSILSLLKDINTSHGITVICNLHQVDFALRFADRIIGLSEGSVVMDAPIDSINEGFIQKIYRGHDKGIFYGPFVGQMRADETLRFTV